MAGPHGARDDPQMRRNPRTLGWAAELHEIGARIAHSDHHKHGACILDNADAWALPRPNCAS